MFICFVLLSPKIGRLTAGRRLYFWSYDHYSKNKCGALQVQHHKTNAVVSIHPALTRLTLQNFPLGQSHGTPQHVAQTPE